jgi:4-hydroxy-tetrahydrodipicolinate synthase
MNDSHLSGVYAAAVTPLRADGYLDLDGIPRLLDYLARRGCHGALLLGTTGEGPSFSPGERLALLRAALPIRQSRTDFRFLAGTGTPSLDETIALTQAAFDLGVDGVVTLPPYYFRKVSDDGLFAWYAEVLRRAVPEGGILLGYHIPPVTGVPLSLDLLARLKDAFPDRFAGIKDSSGEAAFARQLAQRFGGKLAVFTGNDRLFSQVLELGACGCITAMANVISPLLRRLWDAFHAHLPVSDIQQQLNAARDVMDRYPPAAPLLKGILASEHGFPAWAMRPPLLPLPAETIAAAAAELGAIGGRDALQ